MKVVAPDLKIHWVKVPFDMETACGLPESGCYEVGPWWTITCEACKSAKAKGEA